MTPAVRTGLLAALASWPSRVAGRRRIQPAFTPTASRRPDPTRRRHSHRQRPSRPARTPLASSIVPWRPIRKTPPSPMARIGGPDAARFTVNPVTREVRFAAQPDFEAPTDAGGNNVYDISLHGIGWHEHGDAELSPSRSRTSGIGLPRAARRLGDVCADLCGRTAGRHGTRRHGGTCAGAFACSIRRQARSRRRISSTSRARSTRAVRRVCCRSLSRRTS